MWIVDEYYRSQATINQHAVEIKKLIEKHGQPEWIVCDPEDRGARLALSRDHGIANIPARKGPNSVAAGINHLAERLLPDASGYPAFFVFDHCKNFIREIESYIWDDRGTGEGRDRPKPSQADHLLDAARYVCSRLYRSGSLHVG
ncbi:MAG: putative terminase large subunit [Prokaryotic dsDNA virus sp.]|nr:MAG: putative terminase large subunit [Prokaryotic dsDNA virus sp.]